MILHGVVASGQAAASVTPDPTVLRYVVDTDTLASIGVTEGTDYTGPADRYERGSGGTWTAKAANVARVAHYQYDSGAAAFIKTLLLDGPRENKLSQSNVTTSGSYWFDNTDFTVATATSIFSGGTAYRHTGLGSSSGRRRRNTEAAVPLTAHVYWVIVENVDSTQTLDFGIYDFGAGGGWVCSAALNWTTGALTGISGATTTDGSGEARGSLYLGTGPTGGACYLAWVTATPTNASNAISCMIYPNGISATSTQAVIIHHAQLETGTVPTSPVTTNGVAVSPTAAEVFTIPGVTTETPATLYLRYLDQSDPDTIVDTVAAYTSDADITLTTDRAYTHVGVINGTYDLASARTVIVDGGGAEEPPPDPELTGHFVSTTGTSGGDGTELDPWDLETALAHPSAVNPGDTIWIDEGTYGGDFVSNLTGNSANPIWLRAKPGHRVIVDIGEGNGGAGTNGSGQFNVQGDYCNYMDFELTMVTIANRDNCTSYNTLNNAGAHNGFRLFIHDVAQGISDQTMGTAHGTNCAGTIMWNTGWYETAFGRGAGHGVYGQNQYDAKQYKQTIIFATYGWGFHFYGSAASKIEDFVVDGCTMFDIGILSGTARPAILVQGGAVGSLGPITINNCDIQSNVSLGADMTLNIISQLTYTNNRSEYPFTAFRCDDYTITNNQFSSASSAGSSGFYWTIAMKSGQAYSDHTIDNNEYYWGASSLGNPWQLRFASGSPTQQFSTRASWNAVTGYDASSTESTDGLPQQVIVHEDLWGDKRAQIICRNDALATTMNADLSGVFDIGDDITIHSVQDLWGTPAYTGVYDGNPIVLTMTGWSTPAPVGDTVSYTPVGNRMRAFLARLTSDAP